MLVGHTLSVLPFVALAYSGPLVGRNPQCNTGSLQCCQSMQTAGSQTASGLMGLLGLLQGDGQIGLACTPIPIVGAGSGATCQANPVCCNETHFNGLVNLGCDPIDLGL